MTEAHDDLIGRRRYTAQTAATISGWKTTAVFTDPSNLKTLNTPVSIANLQHQLTVGGPVSVSIDATPPDFYYYGGGVYDNAACTAYDLDHSVLAVGFGVVAKTPTETQKYWIVKNSWSSYWGEGGYVRVMYSDTQNTCGVATTPAYVTGLQLGDDAK